MSFFNRKKTEEKELETVHKKLESEMGWNGFNSLTDNGKKLVSDAIKAYKNINN